MPPKQADTGPFGGQAVEARRETKRTLTSLSPGGPSSARIVLWAVPFGPSGCIH